MTKEELKKEAENWIVKYTDVDVETQRAINLRYYDNLKNAYIAGAEPREKEIKSLGKRCLQLQKDKGELTDELTKKADTNHQLVEQMAKLSEKNEELEAQIEKMKCCGNCKNEKIEGACGHFTQVGWCKNWELAK